MPIIRRSDCVPLPIVVCPVVAVVMMESWVARCVHCVENVQWQTDPQNYKNQSRNNGAMVPRAELLNLCPGKA